jgi:hypothetical protein
MLRFYVELRDELGERFGVYIDATDLDSCVAIAALQYPESCVVDIRPAK